MLAPDLCLTPAQQLKARKFVVEMRAKKPIVIIDAYFDGEGRALCPAATGLTHHINPWGDIEPCPIIQFSKESIYRTEEDPRSLKQKFLQSSFLRGFPHSGQSSTRGCIVLERPDLLKQLVQKHGAKDATVAKDRYCRAGCDADADLAIQPRLRGSGEELDVSSGQAATGFTIFGVYQGHDHSLDVGPSTLDQKREFTWRFDR